MFNLLEQNKSCLICWSKTKGLNICSPPPSKAPQWTLCRAAAGLNLKIFFLHLDLKRYLVSGVLLYLPQNPHTEDYIMWLCFFIFLFWWGSQIRGFCLSLSLYSPPKNHAVWFGHLTTSPWWETAFSNRSNGIIQALCDPANSAIWLCWSTLT